MMTHDQALALAVEWGSRGVPAFPVAISWDAEKYGGTGGTNKRPLTNRGHLSAVTDERSLGRLFAAASARLDRDEEWGIGLWPGPAGRVVLDVDDKGGKHGSDELAALEAAHGLPDHPVVLTPSGGTHRWFAKPAEVHVSNDDLSDGIEVRADDGWVVAPGTVTSWGTWEPEEATLIPAPPWPDWLAQRLARPARGDAQQGATRGRWQPLDRAALHPADLAALEALEALGGHSAHLGSDGSVRVTRLGKGSGVSATIGYKTPGVVNVWSEAWEGLPKGWWALDDEGHLVPDGPRRTTVLGGATSPVAPVAPGFVRGTTEAPLAVTWADKVTPKRARFLWTPRIPAGDLTLAVGRGGLGKTVAFGADLAARLTRGDLDGDVTGPCRVLISSAEDSPEHTLVPRLMAAGADLSMVGFIPPTLALPEDVGRLADLIVEHEAGALILDPLNAFLGFTIDSHKDKDLRAALGPVAAIAHETGCAVLAIGHVNKLKSGDAYALVSGSVAYFNGPRSVLVVAPDPEADEDDESARVLVHAKANLSQQAAPLRFRLNSETVETPDGPTEVPVVEWGEEVPTLSATDALAGLDGDERTAIEDAAEWLRQALADGPRLASTVKAEGKREGHAARTVQRAAKRLHIVSRRQGFGEPATWELPVRATVLPHTESGATGATEDADVWGDCPTCGRLHFGPGLCRDCQARQEGAA
jgi:hypothetical protein